MPLVTQEQLANLFRTWIDVEESADWQRMRRVPSTHTQRCLDILSLLTPTEKDSLYNDIALRAGRIFDPPELLPDTPDSPYRKFVNRVFSSPNPHVAVRGLRGMVAALREKGPQSVFVNLPPALIEKADSIIPTNAGQIRKEVKRKFVQDFGVEVVNWGGGDWRYTGTWAGRNFRVMIDYGGQLNQLHYSVQFRDEKTSLDARGLSYEQLLGMGFGSWDDLTAVNLVESVALLSELIQKIISIPDQFSV